MKLTIYSFKTYEDLLTIESVYGYLVTDVCRPEFHRGVPIYPHIDKSVAYFEREVKMGYNTELICNDNSMVNYMLNWCYDNGWEVDVVYCENEIIKVAPLVDGVLTNWTFDWYYPSED